MKKVILSLLCQLFPSALVFSAPYSAYLVNDVPLSYNVSYPLSLKANNLAYAYATADYSEGTPAAKTFTDKFVSSGYITIASLPGLTTAYATNSLTVVSTSGLTGASIAIPNVVLTQGKDWKVGATTALTAASILTAINAKVDWITATRTDNVITLTSKSPGTFYNSKPLSSKNAGITAGSAYFTGGQDNAVVTINGVDLVHNVDWYDGASSATAATALAAAINANATLSPLITATENSPSDGIVALVSDAVGSGKNFTLNSSIPAVLTMSGATMTGGSDSAFTLNSPIIHIPAHGLNLALPVLYTQDSEITPLVDQTTYYVIPIGLNDIGLAETSADAVALTYITLTATPSSAHTFTLTPLAITGSAPASFKWQVSSNNVNWSDMAVASVTVSDFATLPLSTSWDLDSSNDYVRLSVIAPDAGALKMKVLVNGLPLSDFVRTAGDVMTGRLDFKNSPITMSGVSGTITSASTITAAAFVGPISGAVTGNATTATTATNVAGGTASVTTLTASGTGNITGQFTWGAAATRSTGTVTGNLSIPGSLSASSVSAGGTVSGATINISGSGQILQGNATSAEIVLLVPGQSKGAQIFNTTINSVCYSTGPAAGSWILPKIATGAADVACF